VSACCAQHRVFRRAGPVGDRTVYGDQHVVGTAAADRVNACSEAGAPEAAQPAADDTRLQARQEYGIPSAQWHLLHLQCGHGPPEHGVFDHGICSGRHLNAFGERPHFQRDIDADSRGGVEAHTRCGRAREAL